LFQGVQEPQSEDEELRFTDRLIEEHRQALVEPLRLKCPLVPDDAPSLARRVAKDFEYIVALRWAVR